MHLCSETHLCSATHLCSGPDTPTFRAAPVLLDSAPQQPKTKAKPCGKMHEKSFSWTGHFKVSLSCSRRVSRPRHRTGAEYPPGYGAKNISASTTGYDKPESNATAQVVSSVQVNIVESAKNGRE
jgi:hypothetical protein